ncbi:ABC transporter substrate-binding protein [Pseudonocardia ailaonensis]|uniref:ABC transporter substrate-binding protein n=1 Tax=Pseudonocardia ailaonensis TaxID=367279 RepID=A0ABN2MLL3_9PSEU
MPTRTRSLVTGLTALLAVALTACGSGSGGDVVARAGSADAAAATALPISFQTTPGLVNLPELADALGYLAPLTPNRVGDVQGGPAGIQAVATGDVTIGAAFNGSILSLAASGAKVKAVIGFTGTNQDNNTGFYSLESSPVRSARDLIGKSVGVNTKGALQEAVLVEWLAKGGLSKEEIAKVTLVPIPLASAEQALRQKQVDAVGLSVSFQFAALERGGLNKLFSDLDVYGPFTSGSYILSDKFIGEHPAEAKHLVGALAKTIDWSQAHSTQEILDVYTKYLNEHGRADAAAALKSWKGSGLTAPHGTLSDADFSPWLNWLETYGTLKPGQVKVADVFTNDLNGTRG